MMQSISLCDHVTERVVIGLCDHVTERDVTVRDASSKLSACAHQLPITNYHLPITYHQSPPSGTPEQTKIYLFAMGRAEVRVAFNDRAERYHSRNLVTERATNPQSKFVKYTHGQRMKGSRNVSSRHPTVPASASLLSYATMRATPTSDLSYGPWSPYA